ncbi:MAG: DUF5662 family protein [Myxococcota bacterium]
MIEFFESRTREHIDRVGQCLEAVAVTHSLAAELRARIPIHDASKFGSEEREPYIWLTEFHRCRRRGEPFEYPPGVADRVTAAVDHHVRHNRHHPECHAHPDAMSEVDLIEMVCDWTAMALEYDQGSARPWADRTVGTKLILAPSNVVVIYDAIDVLERRWR